MLIECINQICKSHSIGNWYKHEIFHECIDLFEGFAKERERLQKLLNM